MSTDPEQEIASAATALVQAFGSHDTEAYFGCFDTGATFLFYSSERQLDSRAQYEAEWASWEAGGFRVLACASTDQHIQLLDDDVAVFTHRVDTRVRDAEGEHDLAERETIIWRRDADGRWLGVHEHLSPAP
jgi:uncharacterized protein (TIGR02246 family)